MSPLPVRRHGSALTSGCTNHPVPQLPLTESKVIPLPYLKWETIFSGEMPRKSASLRKFERVALTCTT